MKRIKHVAYVYTVSQKNYGVEFGNNFAKSKPIFKIISLLEQNYMSDKMHINFFTTSKLC